MDHIVVRGTTKLALIGLETDPSTAEHFWPSMFILNLIRPRKTSLKTEIREWTIVDIYLKFFKALSNHSHSKPQQSFPILKFKMTF